MDGCGGGVCGGFKALREGDGVLRIDRGRERRTVEWKHKWEGRGRGSSFGQSITKTYHYFLSTNELRQKEDEEMVCA